MQLYTTGDVLRLTRLAANTFDRWCKEGIVNALGGGQGTGNHRVFSVMQALGICVAAKVRESERSCAPSYAGKIVDAFSSMTQEQLLKQFKRKATHFCTVHQGKVILDGRQYPEWVNVQALYKQVTLGG